MNASEWNCISEIIPAAMAVVTGHQSVQWVYIDRIRVPLTILAPTLCGHTECEFGICRCQHTLQALGMETNAIAQLSSRWICTPTRVRTPYPTGRRAWSMMHES